MDQPRLKLELGGVEDERKMTCMMTAKDNLASPRRVGINLIGGMIS